jgi:gamma-glutamyl-gamma-aminobutyrate hydrolase PuuD
VKPIIGIVAKNFDKEARPSVFVSCEVKDAVIANGGVPIGILPPDSGTHSIKTQANYNLSESAQAVLIEQIKSCNGIILQGGWDSFYHELFAARYCFENDVPLLGICAGHSNIIKALGGSIKKSNDAVHLKSMDEYAHEISIIKGTKFHQIIGKSKIQVNSCHHNHADLVPRVLCPSAFDPDGFPEVVEAPNHKFFIGMKFHPEVARIASPAGNEVTPSSKAPCPKDENFNKIFQAFVAACNPHP